MSTGKKSKVGPADPRLDYAIYIYFGCFYPAESGEVIAEILAASLRFSTLAKDTSDETIYGVNLYLGSDSKAHRTTDYIIANDMVVNWTCSAGLTQGQLFIEPAELSRIEEENRNAIMLLTDIHDEIVAGLKIMDLDYTTVRCGWSVISCDAE